MHMLYFNVALIPVLQNSPSCMLDSEEVFVSLT